MRSTRRPSFSLLPSPQHPKSPVLPSPHHRLSVFIPPAQLRPSSYDTHACATHCTREPRCAAFDIYFARDPKFELGPACTNPPPVTNVRCALFTADVAADQATNGVQYATAEYGDTFERLTVGSNGEYEYE